MKKVLYPLLLAAELFVGVLLMISLWNSGLYIPIGIAAAAVVALLVWQLVRLVRTQESAVKRKCLRNIAFVLWIPMAVFVVTYVAVAIALIIAFA